MEEVIPKKARNIKILDYSSMMLQDKDFICEMNKDLKNYDAYIMKNMIDKKLIDNIKKYLVNVANASLPRYEFLKEGCPDFHRVNMLDERSYVASIMHQFLFHPWNQNVFDLFEKMKEIYYLKNLSGGFNIEDFLYNTPNDGHISRLSFHNYPAGGGLLKKHADPVGDHQLTVPVLQMSQKGKDYEQGGLYIVTQDDSVIDIDSMMEKGDVFFFQAEVIHGVAPIDPHKELNWLSFEGRWMMLASVIKTIGNSKTANALQLEE
jgi:hypothetical protein